jgi:hypothetical protein
MKKPAEKNITIPERVDTVKLRETLTRQGFSCIILHNEKEVKDFINQNIPDECSVGLGDSITTCRLNIRNLLLTKGSTIYYSWDGSENYNRSLDTFETREYPAYYLTRLSALTTDGYLLMKDYSKEAAAAVRFPQHVFAFAGTNRVVEQFNTEKSKIKYPVLNRCPEGIKFTIAILPFLDY